MTPSAVVLLGPQFHVPTVANALGALDVSGPVATVTAGWQEWEGEDAALVHQLRGRGVRLSLYERSERVWSADPELAEAHRAAQNELRALRRLYNRQLEAVGGVWVELLGLDAPPHLVEPERESALDRLRSLDTRLLDRIAHVRADFEERTGLHERPAVVRERDEIRQILEGVAAVVIEGGHVAVLLDRLLLFGVADLLGGKVVVGCAGGAMALGRRVVLYNDQPAIGRGHAEVALPGLGLAPKVVPLPDARERLRTEDPDRMRRLSLRLAPDVCVLLDPGARLVWNGSGWTGLAATRVLEDGGIVPWSRAA